MLFKSHFPPFPSQLTYLAMHSRSSICSHKGMVPYLAHCLSLLLTWVCSEEWKFSVPWSSKWTPACFATSVHAFWLMIIQLGILMGSLIETQLWSALKLISINSILFGFKQLISISFYTTSKSHNYALWGNFNLTKLIKSNSLLTIQTQYRMHMI